MVSAREPRVLDPQRLRIAFMGTPTFALPSLIALHDAGHEIVRVLSQPPRPSGRGHRLRPSPVHTEALTRGLEVETPTRLRDAQAQFAALDLDVAVVAAYGLILPAAILQAPRLGCINVHASLLPRWRGAAPIQRAILEGDRETGISIMQMDEGLDTGPVLLTEAVPIGAHTTSAALTEELAQRGAALLVQALSGLARGSLEPMPQPDEGATYARKLEREEGRLQWSQSAERLVRVVRALNPDPGVFLEHRSERIKVLDAEAVPGRVAETGAGAETPGRVIDGGLGIACAEGVFRPLVLQRPGRGALEVGVFLRGFPIPKGTVVG